MTEADLPEVCAVEERSFAMPWTAESFRSLLDRPGWGLVVVDGDDGGVAAYAVYWWIGEEAELASIAVRPGDRSGGVGGALLDHVLEDVAGRGVARVYLEVRTSNEAAAGLYRSRGFEQLGVRPDYYERPREDARVLVKTLS